MVRAILGGRKTETRRMVRGWESWEAVEPHPDIPNEWTPFADGEPLPSITCPYGRPGDLLWVREAWVSWRWNDSLKPREFRRWVTRPLSVDPNPMWPHDYVGYLADNDTERSLPNGSRIRMDGRYRPGRFMIREMARLVLRVNDGGIERLREITEPAAIAEGVAPFFERFPAIGAEQRLTTGELASDAEHRAAFAVGWDEINGDRATWKDNPWVWVVRFEVARGGVRS
jgi:hypothetical protein